MRVKRLLRANSEWTLAGVGNLQRWSIPLPFFWFFHLLSSCRVIAVRQDHSGTATSGLRLYSKTKRDLEKWCLQPVDRLSPICSSEQFQKKGGPISNSFCLRACLCGLMSVFPYFHLIPFLYMLFSFLSFRFLGWTLVHSLSSGSTMPIPPQSQKIVVVPYRYRRAETIAMSYSSGIALP